jgi:hypothetical protein
MAENGCRIGQTIARPGAIVAVSARLYKRMSADPRKYALF